VVELMLVLGRWLVVVWGVDLTSRDLVVKRYGARCPYRDCPRAPGCGAPGRTARARAAVLWRIRRYIRRGRRDELIRRRTYPEMAFVSTTGYFDSAVSG